MKYSAQLADLSNAEAVLVAIYKDGSLSPAAQQFNLNQDIQTLIKSDDVRGEIGKISLIHRYGQRIIFVGVGEQGEISERQFKQVTQKAIQTAKETSATQLVNALTEVKIKDRDLYWNIRFGLESIAANEYRFEQFKTKKTDNNLLKEVIFYAEDPQADLAVQHASAVAFGVKLAKDVANCPPNVCTPTYLSEQAKTLEKRTALLTTTIIGEQEMAELGMNAYLAVSGGSVNEAKLSIMQYQNHPNPNAKPIVLVGKGLTFDSGGISIKPAAEMDEMKYDMCGAAAILGVMNALVELQLPLNVIGVMAGCENLLDGKSYRPGDILTTMKGLTVEVLNTDAEGRLVLCDTLTYVERFEPELVIDVATLTGACVVALGQHNSGLVSTDDELCEQLLQAAQQTQDKAWRLPLSEEYQEQLKSPFADLANIGGRWGGASTAGAFLANFTDKYRWAHLDIAGTAWLQGANKGATGRPVGLLTQFLINQCE